MAQAKIKLTLDPADFNRELDKAKKNLGVWGTDVTAAFQNLETVTRPVIDVLAKIGEGYLNLAKLSEATRRSEESLERALRRSGDATGVAFKALTNLNNELGRKLGIDDDDLRAMQERLSLQGVANEQLDEATKFTIGLARVTGSMESAQRLVSRALQGNVSALKRYLPGVETAADATAELQKLWAQAEGDVGLSNNLDRLTNALDDLQIELAKATSAEEAWTGATMAAADAIDQVNFALQSNGMIGALGAASAETLKIIDTAGLMQVAFSALGSSSGPLAMVISKLAGGAQADEANIAAGATAAANALRLLTEEAQRLGLIAVEFEEEVIVSKLAKVQAAAKKAADEAKRAADELARATQTQHTNEFNIAAGDAALGGLTSNFDLGELGGQGIGGTSGIEADQQARLDQKQRFADMSKLIDFQLITDNSDAWKQIEAQNAESSAAQQQFWGTVSNAAAQGVGDMVGALMSGEEDIGPAMGKLLGSLASQLIPALISMATATSASGAASASVGTPAGIVMGPILAAAAAAFAAAVGNAHSGSKARGVKAMSAAKAGRIPDFAQVRTAQRAANLPAVPMATALRRPDRSNVPLVYNIQFGSGPAIVGGSAHRIARDVQRYLGEHNPGFASGAGR